MHDETHSAAGEARRRGLELAVGLLVVQLLDIATAWQIHAGAVFSRSTGDVLFAVDTTTTVVFIAMAIALVAATMSGRERRINHFAFAYLLMATAQVTLNVALLISSSRTRSDSLLWGLWDLGAAYLMIVGVFTGWYWWCDRIIDGGAFLFPSRPGTAARRPRVIDYLFIAFNTNSTFGPTSESVLSGRVKGLMMYQTILSLAILLVFVARIVGLHS
jgi:hypothetical protein